jgi:AcrR family transcriptional regulator
LDGRRARADRNRDAVVEAILVLLLQGHERPGAAEIAERAGVSLRSVFRHFEDLESLYSAAVARHTEMLVPLLVITPSSDALHARVAALVQSRSRLYEKMAPVRRVAERLATGSESIRAGLDRGRRAFRQQVAELFLGELARLPATDRRVRLDALENATSFASYMQLRDAQGCSPAHAGTVMRSITAALLRA